MDNLIVVGPRTPKELYKDYRVINTTSRSETRSKELSPFFVGPVKLYGSYTSINVENGWQFSKTYIGYGDANGPFPSYFKWAQKGWNSSYAQRYPMGKDSAPPLYSYWEFDGKPELLDYISAKKRVYVPLYANAVKETEAFSILKKLYETNIKIAMWDFDAYLHEEKNMTLTDVANSTKLKFGHAFVLYALLKNQIHLLQ